MSDYPDSDIPLAEKRRAFIISHYVNAEYDIHVLLSGLKLLETYLETGTIPEAKSPRKLKAVTE